MKVTVLYFAMLREASGKDLETLNLDDPSLTALYENLAQRYGFKLPADAIRPAINDRFGQWQTSLQDGDTVAFIPPVAGG